MMPMLRPWAKLGSVQAKALKAWYSLPSVQALAVAWFIREKSSKEDTDWLAKLDIHELKCRGPGLALVEILAAWKPMPGLPLF